MSASPSSLRLGFIALNDSAPLVVARERGLFERHGVRVELVREPSWANLRDKVHAGLLDGAQMLAPMPIAASLGIDGPVAPMVAPMSLGLNGNAITVSNALFERLRRADPAALADRTRTAHALRSVVLADRERGGPPLRFGVVFPYSAHYYELLYWAASAGIDPFRDLEISVVPPVFMAEALRRGRLDGYCVGEPWNQVAVEEGVGRAVISKCDIWNHSPEKVLAFTREGAERRPEPVRAVVRALIEAARWVDEDENRREAAAMIAAAPYVDAPVSVVARGLLGRPRLGDRVVDLPDFHVFHRHAATFPWISHAMWFMTQMIRWGQVEKPFALRPAASEVYRTDLYADAAREVSEPMPEVDSKVEGEHAEPWWLEDASEPIAMGPDRFLDRRVFDPDDIVTHLEQSPVTRLRLRLDDLATWNP